MPGVSPSMTISAPRRSPRTSSAISPACTLSQCHRQGVGLRRRHSVCRGMDARSRRLYRPSPQQPRSCEALEPRPLHHRAHPRAALRLELSAGKARWRRRPSDAPGAERPTTLEAALLRDADMLEQLGAVGALRAFIKVGRDALPDILLGGAGAAKGNRRVAARVAHGALSPVAAPRVEALRGFLDAIESEASELLY